MTPKRLNSSEKGLGCKGRNAPQSYVCVHFLFGVIWSNIFQLTFSMYA